MKYAFLSADGLLFPVAYHLQEAGHEVYVGMIRNWSEVKMVRNTDPKDEERRLSLYDGMFEHRMDARKLVEYLERQNPKDWFVLCDFNFFYDYAERLRKKGYRGLLPNKEDGRLEKERDYAKEFVEANYPNVEVAEHQNFKKIEDAQKYLDKHADTLYVLKGNSDECPTIVPQTDDPQANRMLILDALDRFSKWYHVEGFTLEEQIPDIIEFTPEAYGYDGEVIGVNINLEHKTLGSKGGQLEGCVLSLIAWQEIDSPIYEYFLEPMASMMLRPNELTIWDMSVLYSPSRDAFYFGEYCSNRPGYDSVFAEIASCGGVEPWIDKITSGKKFGDTEEPFGATARILNKQRFDPKKGWTELVLADPADPNIFLWDIKKEKDKLYTAGHDSNTLVVSGAGETVEKAIDDVYSNCEKVVFNSGFKLERSAWDEKDYPQSILHRYEILKNLEI